jgi:hypothetical protein
MARFRYLGDEARHVSMLPAGTLRLVQPDEIFNVPEGVADSYECQPDLYEREDEPADAERDIDDQLAAAPAPRKTTARRRPAKTERN